MNETSPRRVFNLTDHLSQYLGENLLRYYFLDHQHHYYHIKPDSFQEAVSWLEQRAPRPVYLVSMIAVDERDIDDYFRLYAVFFLKPNQTFITLVLELDPENPTYPAITPTIPLAEWQEREIHDLYGITPKDMDLKPLVLHRDWPRGKHFPMRRDFPRTELPNMGEVPHQFDMPHAAGMHQVAVGPIHAAIIEPGHMRFAVTGEKILKFDAQLFYTHKGIEKMAEGKSIKEGLKLAEHVCGLCSFAHSTAYCQAIENLAGIDVPQRALLLRGIGLELERLGSHFADLTAICAAGGFGFGSMQAANFREHIMVMNQDLSGSRFLRGLNEVGGLKHDIADDLLDRLEDRLEPIEEEFDKWANLILGSDSLLDRLETTGYLSKKQAESLGVVGPAARASGIERDVRRDYPYGIYKQLNVPIHVYQEGDALARTKIRIAEVRDSLDLIGSMISRLEKGSIFKLAPIEQLPSHPAIGLVESAKGELVHWVLMGKNNHIYRWHVRSASYMNWRGMVEATMGDNIVPDAPLVNKSFNLCYACTDR